MVDLATSAGQAVKCIELEATRFTPVTTQALCLYPLSSDEAAVAFPNAVQSHQRSTLDAVGIRVDRK